MKFQPTSGRMPVHFVDRDCARQSHRSKLEEPRMLGCGWSKMLVAIGLTMLMMGCDNAIRTASTPTEPSPAAQPSPPTPTGTYSLSGIVSELTPQGVSPLRDAEVEVGVCPQVNHSPASYMK